MIQSIVSFSPAKKAMFFGLSSLSTLGFYRGCQEYKFTQLEGKQPTSTDYFCLSMYGIISASLYVNPTIGFFALYREFERVQMWQSGEYSDSEYYSNPFYSTLVKK